MRLKIAQIYEHNGASTINILIMDIVLRKYYSIISFDILFNFMIFVNYGDIRFSEVKKLILHVDINKSDLSG